MKPNPTRVLIIDDQEDFRFWLSDVLAQAGYEAFSASNGKDALALLLHRTTDLVVTDMLMPEMDGVEIIQALRQQHPNVKIIAVSGGGHVHPARYLQVAETLGASKTLLKPFTASEILTVVERVLQTE